MPLHLGSQVGRTVAFSPAYEPRKRFLTEDELAKLLVELTPDHAARAAFIVATSACWRETDLAHRGDVAEDLSTVLLRRSGRRATAPSRW